MKRVLLIEDDPLYAETVGRLLADRFNLCFSSTVSDGLRQMSEREPDAILLDLTLSDSGATPLDTLERVKQQRHHAAIVIISGNANPKTAIDMIAGNASGYLVKARDDLDGEMMEKEIQKAIASQHFTGKATAEITRLKKL
jgi:DNA-binding NarL/FixJ family response regulator